MIPRALAALTAINPQIPYVSSSSVPGLIQGFYLFALSISGILAFGAIVYGGVRYATSRGNPSGESEGKSWITGALLGLLLLGGAYIVLQTINPGLTVLTMPGLPALTSTAMSAGGSGGTGSYVICDSNGNPVGGTTYASLASCQAAVNGNYLPGSFCAQGKCPNSKNTATTVPGCKATVSGVLLYVCGTQNYGCSSQTLCNGLSCITVQSVCCGHSPNSGNGC